jgi:hypothetical protein
MSHPSRGGAARVRLDAAGGSCGNVTMSLKARRGGGDSCAVRLVVLPLLVLLSTACGRSGELELTFPEDLPRESVVGLRIAMLPQSSDLLRAAGGTVGCARLSVLADRAGHIDIDGVTRGVEFPLESGGTDLELGERLGVDEPLYVHVALLAQTRRFVGEVRQDGQSGAEFGPLQPAPVAEGCACVTWGDTPVAGCVSADDGVVPIVIGALVGPSSEVRLQGQGLGEEVVVRGTRAVLSTAVHVVVPPCTSPTEGPTSCLVCKGDCKRPNLPVSVRVVSGDATVVAPVVLTNADGYAAAELEVGACASGSIEVELGLLGHEAEPVRVRASCVDDLPPPRPPVVLAELPGPVEFAAVAGGAVLLSAESTSTALITWVGPSGVTSRVMLPGERPGDVVALGRDVVVATLGRDDDLRLRRYRVDADTLVQVHEAAGLCMDSGCALGRNACTSPQVCDENGREVSLDVADVDSDGIQEVTVVRAGSGLTVYDALLGRCRRVTAAPLGSIRHVLARMGGAGRTLLTSTSNGVTVAPGAAASLASLPCDPAAPACGPGQECLSTCPAGAPCADTTSTLSSAVCITRCETEGAACGRDGRCTAVPGALACLEPGLSCALGQAVAAVSFGGPRLLARGELRADADVEDVVSLSTGGAPRLLYGEAREDGGRVDMPSAVLLARGDQRPADARRVAVGDVSGDGVDDVVVAYANTLRVWLGGAGVPGEATAVTMPKCSVSGLGLADLDGDRRAEVLVACDGVVRRIGW